MSETESGLGVGAMIEKSVQMLGSGLGSRSGSGLRLGFGFGANRGPEFVNGADENELCQAHVRHTGRSGAEEKAGSTSGLLYRGSHTRTLVMAP